VRPERYKSITQAFRRQLETERQIRLVQPASGQFSRVFAKSKTWFKPKKLISLSGMVEFSRPFDLAQGRLQTKRGFVMPAEAGIHLRFRGGFSQQFDLRQNIRLDRDRRFSHRPRLLDLRNLSPVRSHPPHIPKNENSKKKSVGKSRNLKQQRLCIKIAIAHHQGCELTKED
jgi:hypothetical protein